MISTEYLQRVEQWRAERETSLRKENGWLALAGLFWLNEGENRIGSDPSSQVILPERFPASIGTILLDGKQASLKLDGNLPVHVNESPVDSAVLNPDISGDPSFVTMDGIRMVVIDRPSGTGIRLWDNERPERRAFTGRQWFPISEALRLPARYSLHATPKKVMIPDVFGAMLETDMQGQVDFEIEGRPLSLQAMQDEDGTLEIHFQDTTNGKSSYPSGRYLVVQEPVSDGDFTLDFNFAYNPPCAFTPFATCAFAPQENRLPVPIEAGEKYTPHH